MTDCAPAFHAPQARLPAFVPNEADAAFAALLRAAVQDPRNGQDLTPLRQAHAGSTLPQDSPRVALVLYAPGQRRLLVSRSGTGLAGIERTLARLKEHPRYPALATSPGLRIQLDFVTAPPTPMELPRVGMSLQGARHFEVGVEGIELNTADGKRRLFLPGDAYVFSIMTMQGVRAHLRASFGEDVVDQAQCLRLRTDSYLIDAQGLHRLYRGIPLVGPLTRGKLEHALQLAVDHIQREQEADGKYLYYYDAATDSRVDHEHPTRDPDKNPYYNILRHCGGALTCLYHGQIQHTDSSHAGVRRAIDYLATQSRHYDTPDGTATYIYSERKAKLGGSGLALYLLAEYELTTGDGQYRAFADGLARHLLRQITASGEFIYYSIYLDKPIDAKGNADYFSFYYPGEAVCGLARYLHLVPEAQRTAYFTPLHRALHYLIHVRPLERADQYTNVPSDAWLMMGIKELWDYPDMQRQDYFDFVLGDARQMIAQMYKVDTAPYPDYAGGFYYQFHDYPYTDGARMEGLMGACQLALKARRHDAVRELWPALRLGAWATLHLVNTETAVYAAPNPVRSLGGIRFKYTRQWFRIDTIQHVASFYARMLAHWEEISAITAQEAPCSSP